MKDVAWKMSAALLRLPSCLTVTNPGVSIRALALLESAPEFD